MLCTRVVGLTRAMPTPAMTNGLLLRPYTPRIGVVRALLHDSPSGVHRRVVLPEPREFHVLAEGERWTVTHDASPRAVSTHSSRGDAVALARSLAFRARARVVVHRPDGEVDETFPNDSTAPRL